MSRIICMPSECLIEELLIINKWIVLIIYKVMFTKYVWLLNTFFKALFDSEIGMNKILNENRL